MKKNCKNKNINTTNIREMENWILNDCTCNICKKDHIKNIIPNIKIQKESNIQLNELTLTSKMIIKIQTEIVKKNMLNIITQSI